VVDDGWNEEEGGWNGVGGGVQMEEDGGCGGRLEWKRRGLVRKVRGI